MSKVPGFCLLAAAAIGIALHGADAAAETAPAPAAAVPADVQLSPAAVEAATPAAAPTDPMGLEPIAVDKLADRRGGTDIHNNDMLSQGYVGENQAVNVTTGANIIAEGSFGNAGGIPMVVQNTGNNVLIQNSTILNIQVK